MRRLRWGAIAAILAVTVLAGCGGSSPNRGQLIAKLTTNLQHGGTPADVSACLVREARGLGDTQLEQFANAGANPPAATKAVSGRLLSSCVTQGVGVTALRGAVVQSIRAHLQTGLPPAYANCAVARGNSISVSQLAYIAAHPASGYQLGVQIGLQCLQQPAAFSALRSAFVSTIAQDEASSKLSKAFRRCVLTKAQQISHATLQALLVSRIQSGSAVASARGQALGRQWATECIASGIKP